MAKVWAPSLNGVGYSMLFILLFYRILFSVADTYFNLFLEINTSFNILIFENFNKQKY